MRGLLPHKIPAMRRRAESPDSPSPTTAWMPDQALDYLRLPALIEALRAGRAGFVPRPPLSLTAGSLGPAARGPGGEFEGRCPSCLYSLAGLGGPPGPESGHRCPIDQLILAQAYAGATPSRSSAEHPAPALPAPHRTPEPA